jgi:outer membrane protein TolC
MRPAIPAPSAIPPPPAAWSQAPALTQGPADDLARWWQRLGDADLSALVDAALRHNTSVDAARAALQLSRALREVAAAGLLPTLSGSGSAQRARCVFQPISRKRR